MDCQYRSAAIIDVDLCPSEHGGIVAVLSYNYNLVIHIGKWSIDFKNVFTVYVLSKYSKHI